MVAEKTTQSRIWKNCSVLTLEMVHFRRHLVLQLRTLCAVVVVVMFLLYQSLDERRAMKDPFYVDGNALELQISEEGCSNDTYLMIYVHSSPEHSEKRRVIRNTWASRDMLLKHRAKLLFITGRFTDDNLQAFLETESELYEDIIQGTFYDSYRNLTYKALTALKWVTENCEAATFVLKTDDDIMVDINTFVRLTRSTVEPKLGKQNMLAGYIWANASVVRTKNNKWYTSYEEFPDTFFQDYLSGSAFAMTYDVAKSMYLKSHEIPFFWIDDYFVTGMLAHATLVTHSSLNERYIVDNTANITKELINDDSARVLFVHSPNTRTSLYVWHRHFEKRL